jgi:Rps23 Pro-64 3,4-dihydroxylase Tpa1-like proline 4-hydroxylase
MSFLREDIDFDKCFREYDENGIVLIKDILHRDLADDFYKHITSSVEGEWNAAFPDDKGSANSYIIKRESKNIDEIIEKQNANLKKLNNDEFTYRFDRLNVQHKPDCPCVVCSIREKFLKSGQMFSLISKVTRRYDLNHKFDPFVSRYRSNDYLTLHTDHVVQKDATRHVAIIIHFAKDWKPWYGGNLIITDQDENVDKLFTPKFNSLSIMNVENERMPHFVSEIANGLDKSRYAISYWM